MCGNFGLLSLANSITSSPSPRSDASAHNQSYHKPIVAQDPLDHSLNESIHQVSKVNGLRFREAEGSEKATSPSSSEKPLSVVKILEAQTACTEIRGGQAGGFSSLEYKYETRPYNSQVDSLFAAELVPIAKNIRVRMVARKRHPLASDLSQLYLQQSYGRVPDPQATVTVIGHTRFATSSVNKVSELHPHEWVPFHDEPVWLFNKKSGRFEKTSTTVGIHISHNGDFDAMEGYSQTMVVNEIGLWLERVLHTPNSTNSDSSKIAGCMDLMRVQGRWSAAARLAYIRCILSSPLDVCGGEQLSKTATNVFPSPSHWNHWGDWFDLLWRSHLNNIITVIPPGKFDLDKRHFYSINEKGLQQFINSAIDEISKKGDSLIAELISVTQDWSPSKLHAFIHHAIRGFLRSDLYTAMTELLSRAEGSFGLQSHCTLEPGVVIIASKGQPMSIAYDPFHPIVLFASEAEALAVPVYESGKWLPERIDLDSHGEIFRLGEPRCLVEGSFSSLARVNRSGEKTETNPEQIQKKYQLRLRQEESLIQRELERKGKLPYVLLDCGVEIRCYSLVNCQEATAASLMTRSISITSAPIPYDPRADLVSADLRVTPAVLDAIDHAWSNQNSIERISGDSLANFLVEAMHKRIIEQKDTIDLVIGAVEVSLWLGEQFAADLRLIFPNLNVSTVSANKLLGVGDESATKVFFPGSDEILRRRIGKNTCVLLISQSGQTFPTLHATRKATKIAFGKVWILTGCFNSKMEQAVVESYNENHVPYCKDRVFNNYSGHRPAEPSSVAVAATWHTLTRLLLHIVDTCRQRCGAWRFIHPWEFERAALILQAVFLRNLYLRKRERKLSLSPRDKHSPVTAIINTSLTLPPSYGNEAGLEEDEELKEESSAESKKIEEEIVDRSLVKSTSFRPKSSFLIKSFHESSQTKDAAQQSFVPSSFSSPSIMMNLSDGCIEDIKSLVTECLIPNISDIVGYDQFNHPIDRMKTEIVNDKLVQQGKAWAKHINEPWHMLVFVGIYIILSVGCSITFFGIIGDAILAIVRACIGNNETVSHHVLGGGYLVFTPRIPSVIYHQGIGYTLIGALLQLLDGIFFVFLAKNFTRLARIFDRRPLAARHGKRTIVIVDTPCVHQLTEIFVSKLFSQSYSIVSVDVHGASGLDHFVHRFTHRVVRGLLIALGRPDGRLCCLAKSEASVLLAAKQAAFIRNPAYNFEGSGPEFVTIGHNPFQPNLGLANHIVLEGSEKSLAHYSTHHSTSGVMKITGRRKFVDEYLYDRLFLAQKPFTVSILRALRRTMELGSQIVRANHRLNKAKGIPVDQSARSQQGVWGSMHRKGSLNTSSHYKPSVLPRRLSNTSQPTDEVIPYGVHHIDPQVLVNSDSISLSVFADFVATNRELLHPTILQSGKIQQLKEKSSDPAMRLAFSSKLDNQTRQIQDLQTIVQQFYECRIASLERYLSFCVMFHAMAADCCKPWLLIPWDIARSQSNLRVATTACPISSHASHAETSSETKKLARQLAFSLRKFYTNF